MPAIAANGAPSATPRSSTVSCSPKPVASAALSRRGIRSALAARLAVPRGTMASRTPLPASTLAQARTVPSPPTANTSCAPALTACRTGPSPCSSWVVGRNNGAQPRDSAAARQACANRSGFCTRVRLMMNATVGLISGSPGASCGAALAGVSARGISPILRRRPRSAALGLALEHGHELPAEGRQVVWLAAGDQHVRPVGAHLYLLVDPGAARVADVGLQARPRGQRP